MEWDFSERAFGLDAAWKDAPHVRVPGFMSQLLLIQFPTNVHPGRHQVMIQGLESLLVHMRQPDGVPGS